MFRQDNFKFIHQENGVVIAEGWVDDCHIAMLKVHPNHQNKGLGSSLLKKMEKFIIDTGHCKRITTEPVQTAVGLNDTKLRQFYLKRGYTDSTRSKDRNMYLDNPVMEKTLG